jgi:hypothetical protein
MNSSISCRTHKCRFGARWRGCLSTSAMCNSCARLTESVFPVSDDVMIAGVMGTGDARRLERQVPLADRPRIGPLRCTLEGWLGKANPLTSEERS